MEKTFEDYTFEELTRYIQGRILLAIPIGKFNEEVAYGLDLAFRWKAARDVKNKQK
jgi:hypothetical protein